MKNPISTATHESLEIKQFYASLIQKISPTENTSINKIEIIYDDNSLTKHAAQFDEWMHRGRHPVQNDGEHLLEWVDDYCSSERFENYSQFLLLLKAVADLGYKTTIDVPISEEEFKYRKMIKKFDDWMTQNRKPHKSDTEHLLEWMTTKHALTYQQFLSFCRLLANKGYKTALDVPVSEKYFNDYVREKLQHIISEELIKSYHDIKKIYTQQQHSRIFTFFSPRQKEKVTERDIEIAPKIPRPSIR